MGCKNTIIFLKNYPEKFLSLHLVLLIYTIRGAVNYAWIQV